MRSISLSGFLKRALPFFATFAVALFITSFFVDLRGPRFGMRACGLERHKMKQRLSAESEQLRRENEDLRRKIEAQGRGLNQSHNPGNGDRPALESPVSPVAPHAHR